MAGIPIVPILLAVLLLAGTVALVMSRTNWRWYNITLVAFIMLMSALWFYFAARTLKTQDAWRKEIAQYERRIKEVETDIERLREGVVQDSNVVEPGVEHLKIEVQNLLRGRGRVWRQVSRRGVEPQTGVISATVEQPNPHGIGPNTILYVFDAIDAQNGGEFLGEFEASSVDGQNIQLTPVLPMRAADIQRLIAKRGAPLVLYEVMPSDKRDLLAGFDDAARAKALESFPPTAQAEWTKDGNPPAEGEPNVDRIWRRVRAVKDFDVSVGEGNQQQTQHVTAGTVLVLDPQSAEERIAAGDVEPVAEDDKVYVRPLRDFAILYRDLNLQLNDLLRTTATVNSQLVTVKEAHEKLNQDVAYRQKEVDALKRDLARYQAERDMMAAHVASLEQRVADARAELRRLYDENRTHQSELRRLIQAATEIIDRRAPPVEEAATNLSVR